MHKIKVLDALSVIAMLENCDLDQIIVEIWHTNYYGAQFANDHHPVPVQARLCLRCLTQVASRFHNNEDRASLVAAIKEGSIQIFNVYERNELAPGCTRCERFAISTKR